MNLHRIRPQPAVTVLSFLLLLASPVAPESKGGPWLECEDGYFRYIYKAGDESFLADLKSAAADSYETAAGYLQCLPPVKPAVVIYGSQDDASAGGFFTPLPMHIGLMSNNARFFGSRSLLTHEFTHYLQAERKESGTAGSIAGFFAPDADRALSVFLSDLSVEGSTSFIDGQRRSERQTLAVRAAVLEGRMWNWNEVSTASLRQPSVYRVYLSGMLIQDWLFDTCGDDALIRILEERDSRFLGLESDAFRKYTGVDFDVAWGDIRASLEARYSFARSLPAGITRTPRDSRTQPQWYSLQPTARGYFHARTALDETLRLGFWRPDAGKAGNASGRGLLASDPGSFIPLDGLVADEASASADGSLVAAVINQPAKTSLYEDANYNRIVLVPVVWSADGLSARAGSTRWIPGTGLSVPALSPDGKRLFALKRDSDFFRPVEVDTATGKLTELALPRDLCASALSVSPDGRRLALAYTREGFADVGILDLVTGEFLPVTDDEAEDFSPRFLADGTFVFCSDREDTVAVYRFENGSFSRECIDRIAAWAPVEDGRGGYFYSSVSADGRVIRQQPADSLARQPVPDFRELKPSWIARRNLIWDAYREKGRALIAREGEAGRSGTVNREEALAAPRRHLDIAKPYLWMPQYGIGLEGARYGAGFAGTSTLGTNSWNCAFAVIPDQNQLALSAGLDLSFPLFGAGATFSQDYWGTEDGNGDQSWSARRSLSLGASVPLFRLTGAEGTQADLSASCSGRVTETDERYDSFDFDGSFAGRQDRNFACYAGLSGSVWRPRPAVAFLGGSQFDLSAEGLVERNGDSPEVTAGCIGKAGEAILLAPGLRISLDAGGAWREAGSAHELLPRAVPRWDGDSEASLYGELGMGLSLTELGPEKTSRFLLSELDGTILSLKGFWESDGGEARWLGEYELGLDFARDITVYYSSATVKIGVGWRFTPESMYHPDVTDFCVNLTIASSRFSY